MACQISVIAACLVLAPLIGALQSPIVHRSSRCYLKVDKGNCHENFQRFYYDSEKSQCLSFNYTGCNGNKNNFKILEKCLNSCKPENQPSTTVVVPTTTTTTAATTTPEDYCYLPPEIGPCKASLNRFYFDKTTRECKTFVYGGCKGNDNNFETFEECMEYCSVQKCSDLSKPTKKSTTTTATATTAKATTTTTTGSTSSSTTTQSTTSPTKASTTATTKTCEENLPTTTPRQHEEGDCLLPVDAGRCKGKFRRYYYNQKRQKCSVFRYGGCEGNANNFKTKQECMKFCGVATTSTAPTTTTTTTTMKTTTTTTTTKATTTTTEAPGEQCKHKPDAGPCKALTKRFYYDPVSNTCKSFKYGGCLGNSNNFKTPKECLDTCAYDEPSRSSSEEVWKNSQSKESNDKKDDEVSLCHRQPRKGNCKGRLVRFFFDAEQQRCRRFYYSGCGSNGNNFVSLHECLKKCGPSDSRYKSSEEHNAKDPSQSCESASEDSQQDVIVGKSLDFARSKGSHKRSNKDQKSESEPNDSRCNLQPEKGLCRGFFPSWHYNAKDGKCHQFIYGGCGGNENRFRTENDCLDACGDVGAVHDDD